MHLGSTTDSKRKTFSKGLLPVFLIGIAGISWAFIQGMREPMDPPQAVQTTEISKSGAPTAINVDKVPPELKDIGITEHLGDTVSISELTFKDENDKEVHLSDFFHKGRPVLLTLVYYGCPNLCNFLLDGLVASLKPLDWTVGNQFDIVTVSIDPEESSDLANKKKAAYLKSYGRPEAASGWHFLTGQEDQIRKLASQVGFGFKYDTEQAQYAHSAAIFTLTPEGKISRYLYGIQFQNKDLRLGLLEASNGKIGTVVDRFLLFCYRYDPQTRKYSLYLTKLMQAGCGGTLIIFGGFLALLWRRQRKGA